MARHSTRKPDALTIRVTRLEMTAPPRQTLPVPVNLHIALMRVGNISTAFYRFLYDQVGRRWFWVDRLRMPDEALAAILADSRTEITVLYIDGAPAGFFEISRGTDGVVELVHFGLMEQALGLGVGKWFLLQGLQAAWTGETQLVTVTTNTLDHPRALQLYQMFGFSPVATEETTLQPLSDTEILAIAKRR